MLKVAFYEKDITPPLGGYMWGEYAGFFADDVKDSLYVKSVVINDGENTIVIIALDVCVLPADMHDEVCKRIEKYTGITSDNVTICATHTHKGAPILDSHELGLYADESYKDVLYRLTADCAILASKRLTNANIKYAKGTVENISFVRNFYMGDGSVHTTPGKNEDVREPFSEPDPDLSVLYFEDENGTPLGSIASFACHQDCVGGHAYTGDYSSVISRQLKSVYGNQYVSLFMLGACGDINHIDIHKEKEKDIYIRIGTILADEIVKILDNSKITMVNNICSKKEYIMLDKRIPDSEYIKEISEIWLERKQIRNIRNLLAYEATNTGDKMGVYVQCIKIGEIIIYALPGEMYSWFGKQIRENSPYGKSIIGTLCNGYCGYIPVKEIFGQPFVYETALCSHSCLKPEAGYIISDKALSIAKSM